MALISVPTFPFPEMQTMSSASTPAMTNLGIDGTNTSAAAVIDPPKTGNIRKVTLRFAVVSVAGNVDVRVETLSSGDPSGTLIATNTNAVVAAAANSWVTATLTADAPVVAGTPIAIVFTRSTGTYNIIGVSGNQMASQFPYGDRFASAVWTRNLVVPAIVLEYDDGSIYDINGVWAVLDNGLFTYGSGSTPDEHGILYNNLPIGLQAVGFWWIGNLTADADMVLYDSGGTAQRTASIASSMRLSNAVGIQRRVWSSPYLMIAGQSYRLVLKPTSASTVVLAYADAASLAAMAATPGGANIYDTARTDAGSWTDTNTRQPMMGLYIDAIDTGSGAGIAQLLGGGLLHD